MVLAFLASFAEVRRVDTDISVFLDVFPDELPRLPLEQEVNFGIELKPETTPISKAPYRMAPTESTQVVEPGVHTTQCVTMGSSSVVCEEERWYTTPLY